MDNWLKEEGKEQVIRDKRGVGGTGAEAEIPKLPRPMHRAGLQGGAPAPKSLHSSQSQPQELACLSLHILWKLALTNYGNNNFMYNMENYTFDRQMLRATSCSA